MSLNNKKNTTNTKVKEHGSPIKKPEGPSCSQNRAAVGPSSKATSMRTGAKLGPCENANTSKGAEAKAGSKKVVAPEVARSKPCRQSSAAKQGEEGDAKGAAVGSVSAKKWPFFKIQNPTKARGANEGAPGID